MFKLILYGLIALSLSSVTLYTLSTSDITLKEIKSASVEKLTNSIMNDLNEAMPLIEKSGYKISSLEAELSLPPEVTTFFEIVKIVDLKQQKKILDSLKGNRIGELVLGSLIQTFILNKKVSIENMKLKTIQITISLPPYVTIEYEK